jgi:ATP-dependent helicase HrpA
MRDGNAQDPKPHLRGPSPEIGFPAELPICAQREAIQAALRNNSAVIVCGDTGSGKTTQLPKMALQMGRGAGGRLIGCTQPRRLAVTAMARRVAEEFGETPGGTVGFQHRFERQLSAATRIKFMTDGILLAEARADPLLRAYDTLIVDEAHERSLNIDFLLGLLRRLLPRRPDLRVVVSSATLDAARFADFFGGAPTLAIPGRLHPIKIRYRAPGDDDPDLPRLVANAVHDLAAEGPGDILVFLPGERDIRETAEALRRRREDGEIIPLLASLPAGEQQRAFRLAPRRRIVLATNVAETSVTIPGIRYVIDSGLARISRYEHRTQVQRLRIEPVSQASANQRAGRCGRLGPGICVRLYGEEDFRRRDAYTDPEILRSSLAGVILTMIDLRLGDIAAFPFLDPPLPAMVRAGLRELQELGAVKVAVGAVPALTPIGWQLARMPVEPRLARMLLAAHGERALRDALIVVAGLACDDPRRRPVETRDAADRAHAAFNTPLSDFAAMLRLWQWWEEQTGQRSQSVARRLCRDHYLSFSKMREWRDVRDQLERICRGFELDTAATAGGDTGLHRALLAGLLGRIGQRDPERGDYRGARGLRFALFPGSGLFRKPPAWIVAGELMETSRLYARAAAAIDPSWIESVAGDLCKRSHHSPAWDAEAGFVRATEKVTLYGLTIVEGRRCDYSRINPAACRDLFIRHAIVAGEFPRPSALLQSNQELLNAIRRQEEQLRRHGQLLDEERLTEFFDSRLPPAINNANDLRRWLRQASPRETGALLLKADDWLAPDAVAAGFPDTLRIGEHTFALRYRHAPGEEDDGITCLVRRDQADALRAWRSDWLVPGALPGKLSWMLAALPAPQRRALGPLDEAVARCLSALKPGREPLAEALAALLRREFGVRVAPASWPEASLPAHLRVRFVVRDDSGMETAAERDLEALLRRLGVAPEDVAGAGSAGGARWHADGLRDWSCGALPESVDVGRAGWPLENYPALVDDGATVSLRLFTDPGAARDAHACGVARLCLLALGREAKAPPGDRWPLQAAHFLRAIEYTPADLARDTLWAVAMQLFVEGQPEVRDGDALARRVEQGRGRFAARQDGLRRLARDIVCAAAACQSALDLGTALPRAAVDEMRSQLAWLVFPGFVRDVPGVRLESYPRYLEALRVRLERLPLNPAGDARRAAEVATWWERYEQVVTAPRRPPHDPAALAEYRWMVEEYRVSLFAQELRTPRPVSPKRLEAQWGRAMAC